MSVADNFDYSIGTLNRKNTMYLSVINSQDAVSRTIKKLYTQRDWSTNLYNLGVSLIVEYKKHNMVTLERKNNEGLQSIT